MGKFNYQYLIIGSGMTADSAVQGIREHDKEGSIGLISSEKFPPYARPPLSKSIWKGEEELDDIDLGTEDYDLEFHLGKTVKKIDRDKKNVNDNEGNEYSYQKLLIATGGSPRKLPNMNIQDIIYYRTRDDFEKLKTLADKNNSFGVIGGGFIGSEIAAGIKMYNSKAEVSMIFPESGICALIFPKKLSDHINNYYREKGITVLNGELVSNIRKENGKFKVTTKSEKLLTFDVVVAGLGIEPNVELAKDVGLRIDNGIKVNKYLQTEDPDIYAAGDVARYPDPVFENPIRVEHEDNAIWMGWVAGENMTGEKSIYDHQSMFYSDLFDYGYEAVGLLDPKLDLVEDWNELFEEGVIYYLKDNQVKGVLLWNVWDKADDARELIAQKNKMKADDLKGRIK